MRVAEIITDYRNILNYIAAIRASPSAEEYNEEGYLVLRRCVAEAQALSSQPFQTQNGKGDEDLDKMHLRRYERRLYFGRKFYRYARLTLKQNHRGCGSPEVQGTEDISSSNGCVALGQL